MPPPEVKSPATAVKSISIYRTTTSLFLFPALLSLSHLASAVLLIAIQTCKFEIAICKFEIAISLIGWLIIPHWTLDLASLGGWAHPMLSMCRDWATI